MLGLLAWLAFDSFFVNTKVKRIPQKGFAFSLNFAVFLNFGIQIGKLRKIFLNFCQIIDIFSVILYNVVV